MLDLSSGLKREELENLHLFRDVNLDSIQGLLEGCSVREVDKGDVVIHAHQPNHYLYLLLTGRLRVHLKLTLDPVAELGPGELVGELSIIDGQNTSAYVVAHIDSRLLVIDEKIMWSLVDSSHGVARNLLFVLARRLRHGNSLILSRQQLQRDYQNYAVVDALTGVYNQRWLETTLPRHVDRAHKGGWAFSLLIFDIDGFTDYNDNHGRAAGDRVLYAVARTLREGMRPGEVIVRSGDDEFIALLPDTDSVAAHDVAERVRKATAEARVYTVDHEPLPSITVSIGVAQMLTEDTPASLVEAARSALAQAREAGGNRVSEKSRSQESV